MPETRIESLHLGVADQNQAQLGILPPGKLEQHLRDPLEPAAGDLSPGGAPK